MRSTVLLLLITIGAFCEVPVIPFKVIRSIPHDTDAFTQGLAFLDGYLWESTGTPGGGTRIRQIDPNSGEVLRTTKRDDSYFGEGLASDGSMLYQLSWKQGKLHVFSYPAIYPVAQIPYYGEGWGLAFTPQGEFFMSNGSSQISVRNHSFAVTRTLSVTKEGKSVEQLNELEWANGKLWSNIWYSDTIVAINAETGIIEQQVDLSPLRKRPGAGSSDQVLNGIAHVSGNQYWVTGKFWPSLFLIELERPNSEK